MIVKNPSATTVEYAIALRALVISTDNARKWGQVRTGDIDAKITSADALLILQHVVGKVKLSTEAVSAGAVSGKKDKDGNPMLTSADALLILQYVVGKITKFPVQS